MALAVVALLHAGALLILLTQRSADAKVVAEGAPIQVSLISVAPRPEYTPPIKSVPIEKAIQVPMPEVTITLPVERAVTVAVIERPSPPPVSASAAPRTITLADYLKPPAPQYPRAARQTRQQGVVTLLVSIDIEGRPARIEIAHSSGHATLDRAAIDAVRTALFRPFVEAGVAQSVQVLIPIEFALSQRVART